jgi:hypothetical protein
MAPHHPALFLPLLFLHTGEDAAETELLTTHHNTQKVSENASFPPHFPRSGFSSDLSSMEAPRVICQTTGGDPQQLRFFVESSTCVPAARYSDH